MLVLILVVIVNSFIEKSLLESSMTLSPITKYWNYIHESKESFLIMLLISRSCYSSNWLPKPLLHRQYVFRLSSYSPRPVLAGTIVPYGGKLKNIGWTRSAALSQVPYRFCRSSPRYYWASIRALCICQHRGQLVFERCRTQKAKTLISISRCVKKI